SGFHSPSGTSGSIRTRLSPARQATQPTSGSQSAGLPGSAFASQSGWRAVQRHSPGSSSCSCMAAEPIAVGLDVGTTGVKALAVTAAGEVVARAEEEYPLSTPRPGWSEQ